MKKMIPVAAMAMFVLMFTSCKKDYNCTCEYYHNNNPIKFVVPLGKTTKKKADEACKAEETGPGLVSTTATCSL